MRVEFLVTAGEGGWSVSRGQMRPVADYDDREKALQIAENLARETAKGGDTAVVKLREADRVQEVRSFAPDVF